MLAGVKWTAFPFHDTESGQAVSRVTGCNRGRTPGRGRKPGAPAGRLRGRRPTVDRPGLALQ